MLKHDVFYNREHSGKEELNSYLPKYWLDIKEMVANNTFAGYTLDRMAADMEGTVKDRFFDSCSEIMLVRYEQFLHITPAEGVSIEDRRSMVKMKWNGCGKMTGTRIKTIVKEFCGADCEVIFGSSQLIVNMTFRDNPADYMAMIREAITNSTIPSHIEIVFKGDVNLSIIFLWNSAIEMPRMDLHMDFSMNCASAHSWFPVGCRIPIISGNIEDYAVEVKVPIVVEEKLSMDNNVLLCSDSIFSEEAAVLLLNTLDVDHTEDIETSVDIKKNLHYFDGSVCWDGSVLMNSYIKKEEL